MHAASVSLSAFKHQPSKITVLVSRIRLLLPIGRSPRPEAVGYRSCMGLINAPGTLHAGGGDRMNLPNHDCLLEWFFLV